MHPVGLLRLPEGIDPNLILSLAIFVGFAFLILVIALIYKIQTDRIIFRHFKHLLTQKGLDETTIKKLYKFLKRRRYPFEIILEDANVVEEAAKATGLDADELKKKLGFDRKALLEEYMKRLEEMRKEWNRGRR